MNILNSVKRLRAHYRDAGTRGFNRAIHTQLQNSIGSTLARVTDSGTNIFEREWDLLLVLDACRSDLMKEVAEEYSFVGEETTITSVGSTSAEWLRKTFDDEHAEETMRTVYITGNPHTATELDAKQFDNLDEMWRYAWDEDAGTIRPRPITDHVIDVCRRKDPDRVIGHYMQPHYPFLDDLDIRPSDMQGDIWTALRDDDYSEARIWDAYRKNLRLVLDDVELLLKNVDAEKVFITADHGNAVGEYGFYGHPPGFPLKVLRDVPWITTSSTDEQTHQPTEYDTEEEIQKGW